MRGLSPVAASGGHSSSRCAGLSPSRPLLLRSTGSRRAGSVVVAHGPSCSAACGILPDQGSNPCPLHWQADSQPLRHRGSPYPLFFSLFPCRSLQSIEESSLCSTLGSYFLPSPNSPWPHALLYSETRAIFSKHRSRGATPHLELSPGAFPHSKVSHCLVPAQPLPTVTPASFSSATSGPSPLLVYLCTVNT